MEAESPRGRIALARACDSGSLKITEISDRHLTHCLGCRGCEAVCPAEVDYGAILSKTRAQQRERHPPGWRQRAAERLAVDAKLRSAVFTLYRWLWPALPTKLRPLPRPPQNLPERAQLSTSPSTVSASPSTAPRVAVFTGCFAQVYDVQARAALSKLLCAIGIEAVYPPQPPCCGALHAHAGDRSTALRLSNETRRAFAQAEIVLSLASGCHEALADSLGDDAAEGLFAERRIVDALAFLARQADALRFAPRNERIALHLPCTQRNVVKSDDALRTLLARIPGLEVIELDAGFGCCGAAGTQMLTMPERAAQFRRPLLEQLAASGVTRVLSANIGCRLHLGNGTRLPMEHPLEYLAECLDITEPGRLETREGQDWAMGIESR
jgi:glycolate oxidase iron-sulfur subunit